MRGVLLVSLTLGCAGPSRFVELDVSPTHACAVDRVGELWCWGEGPAWETGRRPGQDAQVATRVDLSQVGLADRRARAVAAGIERTCALRDDGRVSCWMSPYDDLNPEQQLFELFATDTRAFTAVRIDGIVLTALNALGGLDQREIIEVRERGRLSQLFAAPLADPIVAFDSECAADASGDVVCWGWQRDIDTGRTDLAIARVAKQLGEIVDLAGPCVVGADGRVRCPDGDLSRDWSVDGTNLAVVEGLEDVVEIERSDETVCVRLRDGSVHCRGHNHRGELGDGTTRSRADFHELASIHGAERLRLEGWGCALGHTEVWCWGTPGLAFAASARLSPIESHRLALDAARVYATGDITCVVQRDDEIRCFGLRSTGGMQASIRVRKVHAARGIARPIEAMYIDYGAPCLIAAGQMHCARRQPIDDDDVLSFGRTVLPPVAAPPASTASQQGGCSIDEHELVRCQYEGRSYEPPARGVVELVAGRDHHCARERGGDVVCWGPNFVGEIGKLPARTRLLPTPVVFDDD